MANSNRFAPDGTKNVFEYTKDGNAFLKNPITRQEYEIRPIDTLLYEIVPPGSSTVNTFVDQFAYDDLTIQKIESKCNVCERPVREHTMSNTTSVMRCICGSAQFTQSYFQAPQQ